ncbi:alpha/beta hydrolase [Leptothrix discophora]|uniref:Alpha/beta hydrolase n=2 Tax=Leptothrix discophora TaxID=89 RepID=A0ABT9G1H9_LEPDI|nr:alpha/beta hydrolase [Leptothrix discophora]MDP4300033.1 alpha/beta hydrolase [Leptothrix discophora]
MAGDGINQAALDALYDNRARVPEHGQIFERWAGASARARERLPGVQVDLAYGPTAGQRLDVFPCDEDGAPVLFFIHGGWWRSLDKSQHGFVAPAFVQGGATVVVPNYDLCPAVSIGEIAQQMTRALAWTWREIGRFGADRRRLLVVGHSAGAHLAAMMLACDWAHVGADLPTDLVRRSVGLSGVYDLEPVSRVGFLRDDLRLAAADVPRWSPASFPAPRGRHAAFVGGDESTAFLAQNAALARAWGPRAVPVCETLPGLNHFTIVDELAEPGTRAQSLVFEWLDEV